MDTIARVRRALHAQGWSMKKISRELQPHTMAPVIDRFLAFRSGCERLQGCECYRSHGQIVITVSGYLALRPVAASLRFQRTRCLSSQINGIV